MDTGLSSFEDKGDSYRAYIYAHIQQLQRERHTQTLYPYRSTGPKFDLVFFSFAIPGVIDPEQEHHISNPSFYIAFTIL